MTELEEFRQEARSWILENCPKEMRDGAIGRDTHCWGGRKWKFTSSAQKLWLERCIEKGWTVPTWPVEYGGAGLPADKGKAIFDEMVSLGVRRPLYSFGIQMLGPALLKHGTPEQKAMHLPAIAKGEIRWCQGYSEPNAGSDLASLKTKCEDGGDHWLVNGQKIWTSKADESDWIFAMVRTDNSGPKHSGITFILIDMETEGVTVKPIELISGASPFCETFFDNVKVPKEYSSGNPSHVGEVGKGWAVGMYLLTHERGSLGGFSLEGRGEQEPIVDAAIDTFGLDEAGRLNDSVFRAKLVQGQIDDAAFAATVDRMNEQIKSGQEIGAQSSLVKYYSTQIIQRGFDLRMDIGGADGLEIEGGSADVGALPREWLYSRAYTILGGTSEIQLNILSKRVLELPSK